MENPFGHHEENVEQPTLSRDERERMWSRISRVIQAESGQKKTPSMSPAKRLAAVAVTAALVLGGAGTVASADNARPGDLLFPIDRAAERIRLAFSSDARKEKLEISFASERVDEVKSLVAQSTSAQGAPHEDGGASTTTPGVNKKALAQSEEAISLALEHIEKTRDRLQEKGHALAADILDDVLADLSSTTLAHLQNIEKFKGKFKTTGRGGGSKVALEASSKNIKSKFLFEEKDDGKLVIKFEQKSKKNKSKDRNEPDDDEEDEDEDEDDHNNGKGKSEVVICHKGFVTIEIASPALSAHLAHGDTVGQCRGADDEDEDGDDDDGDEDEDGEDEDTTAPNILNIDASVSTNAATIRWETDENADSAVFYGTTNPPTPGNTEKKTESALAKDHELTLTSLLPDTKYFYFVRSRDAAENTATSSVHSLITDEETDTTAPLISNLDGTASTTTLTVTWDTDEPATSAAWIGTSTPLTIGNALDETSDMSLATNHALSFAELVPDTSYFLFARSTDAAGNTATSSQFSVTTLPKPDTTPPVISALTVSGIATTTATVSWTTDEGATSKLLYATSSPVSSGNAIEILADGTLKTSHNFSLSGLASSTTYHFTVSGTDDAGNTATSSEESFTTTP